MTLDLTEEKVRFDFPNATALFKFDEPQPSSPTFHGAPMKAVDVLAEFPTFQLWIEIKEYPPAEIAEFKKENSKTHQGSRSATNFLLNYLKYKFRDTFLYRYCEEKTNSPIVYVFLTNLDDAMNSILRKKMCEQIPAGIPNPARWNRELIAKGHVLVVNTASWNRDLSPKFGTCQQY